MIWLLCHLFHPIHCINQLKFTPMMLTILFDDIHSTISIHPHHWGLISTLDVRRWRYSRRILRGLSLRVSNWWFIVSRTTTMIFSIILRMIDDNSTWYWFLDGYCEVEENHRFDRNVQLSVFGWYPLPQPDESVHWEGTFIKFGSSSRISRIAGVLHNPTVGVNLDNIFTVKSFWRS